jgi:hypothetical protein
MNQALTINEKNCKEKKHEEYRKNEDIGYVAHGRNGLIAKANSR